MRWICACMLLLLWADSALGQTRVGVGSIKGPSGGGVRDAVVEAIEEGGAEVVSLESGVDLSSSEGRLDVARGDQLSAVVVGTVRKRGKQLSANLVVYDGASGEVLGEASIGGRKPALVRNVRSKFSDELGGAIAEGKAPEAKAETEPEAEPEAPLAEDEAEQQDEAEKENETEKEPQEEEAEDEPDTASDEKSRALEFSVAVRLQTRKLTYKDAQVPLGQHTMRLTPALRIEARWYPAAHFTDGFASNLGLDLHGQVMLPVEATRGDFAFKTQSKALGAGLRLRVPLGEPNSSELGVHVGYGLQDFTLADDGAQTPGVPSVSYSFLRLGVDGRVVLADVFGIDLRVAYLLLLGYGELAQDEWYPHTGGGGIEAELGLSYSATEFLAIRAGGGIVRYGLSLNPELTDDGVVNAQRIAGGVTDQIVYGTVGAALSF